MLAAVVLALCLASCASANVRPFTITHIMVPETVEPGREEVDIECRYDANFTLFSWFKGTREFFRYRPGSAPSTRTFPIVGVGTVELVTCGPTACRLRLGSFTEEATGLYRCDIERDVPPYKYHTKTGYMKVLGHEYRRPIMDGLAQEYGEGQKIQACCRGAPDSELRWYINGQELADLRGSPKLTVQSTRLMFTGVPAKVTIQCAEIRSGKVYGSRLETARWHEFEVIRKNEVKPMANSASVYLGHLGILGIVNYILF